MTTLSVAAVVQPSNNPPRVQVTVTDTGTSPAITSATVTRTDASGATSVVRTTDGNPLVLVTSGSNRVGVVYDAEVPYGVAATYSTVEQPANTSGQVTLDVGGPWLVHPGVPDRSMAVEFYRDSFSEESLSVSSGVFRPMGRRNAVVVTDGQRKSGTGSFSLWTNTLPELAAVRALLDDAGVVQLNVPPALGLGINTAYVAILDVSVKRPSDVGSQAARIITCPYVVVDAPVGGSQAQYTWADVLTTYPTWAALMAANSTWAQVQAPTS